MGMIRRSFSIFTLGLVRGRSRKQRVANKTLAATLRTARATESLDRRQQRDYGSGYDQWGR